MTSTDENRTQTPAADSTPPAREPRSYAGWLATLFVLALVGWMGSGYLYPAEDTATAPQARQQQPFTVEAFASNAKAVTQFVAAEGQVSPDRITPVRAKVGGTVEEVLVAKGDFLEEGTLIARIALDDRSAQVAQAEAELSRRQGEYDRVSGLADRGYSTAAEVEAAQAELASAKAALAAIRQTTGDTEIRAPITGVLDAFDLDLGEFVAASAEIGQQIDIDPLTVDVQIAQQNVGKVKVGQPAAVTFITGEAREGTVRYIAANADTATRTFPVEVVVENPDRDIPAGISAQVRIPTGETPAHFISAALLALGPDGTLGVKAVGEDDVVSFHPIELVRAETDGIWVSGLPEELRIISVGQGFVAAGETVRVVAPEPGESGEPETAADPQVELPEPAPDIVGETASEQEQGAGGIVAQGDTDADMPQAATTDESTETASIAPQTAAEIEASLEALPVRALQQRLETLGYSPGTVDGVLGASTRAAIRAYQRDNGLEVTGEVTPALAGALLLDDAAETAR
ncbi:putative efflux transporter, RND family, membrane fusion protein subunit [Aurantimonas manganoxydans SI85-9A1]|uniref:Putative efflux transporter, RND family, membrane fusion protein subunit n=1 Tax=Aurantimonas manganoxydans (strain ATCC BAA-1229 / DSM 21871 / SI85-9A1) TaxID=287752 RepID=Q1YLK6_AURMS|nr:efflux RND transporter periplasmic adaptor subunit [Aurantimonas manganoxydans]EAS51725.1 putative efflux transporter, RND family, membrane fusion protein subunit [Aurantimonas manganoxydans SI85-9A1]